MKKQLHRYHPLTGLSSSSYSSHSNIFSLRIVRTKAEKGSTYKYVEGEGDISCPSNSSENNRTLNEHSSTNSSDDIHTDHPQPFTANWNFQDHSFNNKDSRRSISLSLPLYSLLLLADSILITVEEEKATILDNFYQENPYADYSQMDEIIQRTQLDEHIIRVFIFFKRSLLHPSSSSSSCLAVL